jgi:protein-tyrosine-phosphatase
MSAQPPYKVLILCTGNSARSILGEYILRAKGAGRFETFSAGSHPTGRVNPLAVRVLRERYGLDASAARSKSWEEFKDVKFDFVITVCDHARESCPVWPGQPMIAHWGSPDPAAEEGTDEEKLRAFVNVASQIARRVELFCALPEQKLLDAVAVRRIGEQFPLEDEAPMKR